MAKWDFKIVGASFVKELVPVGDDVNPRSQSFMQPSFDLEGDKIVMKESGQYKTAISFTQIGEIDGVAPTDLEDAYAKLLVLVENFNGGGGAPGTTPSLPQVLAIGDRTFQDVGSSRDFAIVDRTKYLLCFGSLTMTLDESVTDFPLDSLLQFRVFEPNVSLVIAGGSSCYYLDSAIPITSINLSAGDYCELKNIALNTWILTVTNNSTSSTIPTDLISADSDNALTVGTDSKLFVAESTGTLPCQELIFTAVQTAPQTGITSGTLIEGGRYTIANADITADFVISGAADNEIGTVFIANATPPDWGVLGELSFSGNPIVTILNNPLSDTYTSGYTDIGIYYLEGLLDFPLNTFPKYGDGYVDVVQRIAEDFTGVGQSAYLWYKNPSNDKQIIFRSGANGDLTDDILDGSQLFIVKIFNS